MPNLFDEKNKAMCCGCSACFVACPTSAITLKPDAEGFLYPKIDELKCVECQKCMTVCPIKANRERLSIKNTIIALKHVDKRVILNSSSGGAFTALSDYVIKKGGVVYGVVFDKEFRAVHVRADNAELRDRMRSSKYLQSDLGEIFKSVKEDIDKGMLVLFTGTPCQVSGIRKYLNKDYENFYTVDVICHGVPSPLMFSEHIKHIEKKRKVKVVNYNCRSKIKGWHKHIEQAIFINGKTEAGTPLLQEHKTLFYKGYVLRPSCYECKFTNFDRPSDITIGDFWGIDKELPDWDDNLGTSILLLNSKKGEEIFRLSNSEFISQEVKTYGRQPQLEKSATKPSDRKEFWEKYSNFGYSYISSKYAGNSIKDNLKYLAKRILKRF